MTTDGPETRADPETEPAAGSLDLTPPAPDTVAPADGPPSASTADEAGAPPVKRRRPVAVIILSIVLGLAVVAGAWAGVELWFALAKVDQQESEIDDLTELLDEKEEFGAAMESLMDTAALFDGLPYAELVPFDEYEDLAQRAWVDRWDAGLVSTRTAQAVGYQLELERLAEAADDERGDNATRSEAERVLDSIGKGFTTVVFDNADAVCETDAIGCVLGDEPYVVHLDKADFAHPSMDEWGERLITYHEFAHVLQITNPEATDAVVDAFGGDWEFMADCYALVKTNSTTLDHRVWVSSYQYWDVSYGYGKVCSSAQRGVIRDWIDAVGVEYRTVSQ